MLIEHPVIVEWLDTISEVDKAPLSEAMMAQYSTCKTIGFIIKHDLDKIIVAQSIYYCPGYPEVLVSDYSTIPAGCIVKITKMEEYK